MQSSCITGAWHGGERVITTARSRTTTKRSDSILKAQAPSTTVPAHGTTRATMIAQSRITTKRSDSILKTAKPFTVAATHGRPKATTTAQTRTTAKQCGWIRMRTIAAEDPIRDRRNWVLGIVSVHGWCGGRNWQPKAPESGIEFVAEI